jgi:hypothetical protein
MALLAVAEPTIDGAPVTFVTPAGGGDTFPVDDDTTLHVRNASGGSINVTLTSVVAAEPGLAPANKVIAVGAGVFTDIRIKPASRFKDANGRCTATCSATTSITVGVTRTP